MAIARELLEQSAQLLAQSTNGGEVRRAISTAYYALFHLLVQDGSDRWQGIPGDRLGIERAYNHGQMRSVSEAFTGGEWKHWSDQKITVPLGLRLVARAFVDLQSRRHLADYDNYKLWSFEDARDAYDLAVEAFKQWAAIREHPLAGTYLLAMLLGKGR